jgi:hypothetical protein
LLTEPTRGEGKWQAHREFGLNSEYSHIVEFDIASFYEYIDHEILLEELVLKTGNVELSRFLTDLLTEVQGRRVGLPQLSGDSDVLADTYLDVLARRLARDIYETSRFADDFRVLASSFEDAGSIIERASEYARDLGLVLSTEKTVIFVRSRLRDRFFTDEETLDKYFADAQEALSRAQGFFWSDYGESVEQQEDTKDSTTFEFEAYNAMLEDWFKEADPFTENTASYERLKSLIPRILSILRHEETPISEERLIVLSGDSARMFESVMRYTSGRIKSGFTKSDDPWGKSESYWKLFSHICRTKRQTPWMKLWLIYVIRIHETSWSSPGEDQALQWLDRQIDDRHELVRGEAAWALATKQRSSLNVRRALDLYQQATELTRPLLAACISRIADCPRQTIDAVQNDGALMKEAIRWATSS